RGGGENLTKSCSATRPSARVWVRVTSILSASERGLKPAGCGQEHIEAQTRPLLAKGGRLTKHHALSIPFTQTYSVFAAGRPGKVDTLTTTGLSDDALIAGCLGGDQQAWIQLLDRYKRLIYGVSVRFGFDTEDRHDVFQAVCLETLKN